jgi:hypothetical protein
MLRRRGLTNLLIYSLRIQIQELRGRMQRDVDRKWRSSGCPGVSGPPYREALDPLAQDRASV